MSHNSKGLSEIITKEFLIEYHINQRMSLREIARIVGCKHPNIRKYMRKYNLISHTDLKYNQYGRIHTYDDNFFSLIDTEEKAYWLGFIMADGYTYHSKKQKRLRICLSTKDKQHLELFKTAINGSMEIRDGEHTIKEYPDKIYYHSYIDVHSTKLCDDLIQFGIGPAKSNRESIPLINSDLINHFIRGFFDGDGSWPQNNQGQWNWISFSQRGSHEILNEIKSILEAYGVKFRASSIHVDNNISLLTVTKRIDVLKIIDYLYQGANIYMERKRAIALRFKKTKPKRLTIKEATKIRSLYSTGRFTYKQLSQKFDTSSSNIGLIVNNKSLTS